MINFTKLYKNNIKLYIVFEYSWAMFLKTNIHIKPYHLKNNNWKYYHSSSDFIWEVRHNWLIF